MGIQAQLEELDTFSKAQQLRVAAVRKSVEIAQPKLAATLEKEVTKLVNALAPPEEQSSGVTETCGQDPDTVPGLFGIRGASTSPPRRKSSVKPQQRSSIVQQRPKEPEQLPGGPYKLPFPGDHEVSLLRARLQAAEAALIKGDWNGDWRNDIRDVAAAGDQVMHAAEQALQSQTHLFRTTASPVAVAQQEFVQLTGEYQQAVHAELVKMRDTKVALCQARAAQLQEAVVHHDEHIVALEAELLRALSRLAKETEAMMEVGHAVKRGDTQIPVGVVAGAWRRSILTSIPLLQQIWDRQRVPEPERQAVICKLLAVLSHSPSAVESLNRLECDLHMSRPDTLEDIDAFIEKLPSEHNRTLFGIHPKAGCHQ